MTANRYDSPFKKGQRVTVRPIIPGEPWTPGTVRTVHPVMRRLEVEFDPGAGGGTLWCDFEDVRPAEPRAVENEKLTSEEFGRLVSELAAEADSLPPNRRAPLMRRMGELWLRQFPETPALGRSWLEAADWAEENYGTAD